MRMDVSDATRSSGLLRYHLTSKVIFSADALDRILAPLGVDEGHLHKWRCTHVGRSFSFRYVLNGIASGFLTGVQEEKLRHTDGLALLNRVAGYAAKLRAAVKALHDAGKGVPFDMAYAGNAHLKYGAVGSHLEMQIDHIAEAVEFARPMAAALRGPEPRKAGQHGKPYVDAAIAELCELYLDLTGEEPTGTRKRPAETHRPFEESPKPDVLAMADTPGGKFVEAFFREMQNRAPVAFEAAGITSRTMEAGIRKWRLSAHKLGDVR